MTADRPQHSLGGAREGQAPTERPAAKSVFQAVLRHLLDRGRFLQSMLLLILGAGLLVAGWNAGPARRPTAGQLDALTARGEGSAESFWWRIDFDPDSLSDQGTNWLGFTRPELCARLRFETPEGESHRAVYCRRWQKLFDLYLIRDAADLAPGVPPPWLGPDGLPSLELHLSPRAHRWLAERPPAFWIVETWQREQARRLAESQLDLLDIALDTPLRHLAREWNRHAWRGGPQTFRVAYDPDDPTRAIPVSLLNSERGDRSGTGDFAFWVLVAGGLFWAGGWIRLLGAFQGLPNLLAAVLIAAATLAFLPWWADRAGPLLSKVWEPAEGAVDFLKTELITTAPTIEMREPDYRGEPDDVRRVYSFETSRFASLLDQLEVEAPTELVDEYELLDQLAAATREQIPESRLRDDLLAGID